MLGLGFVLLYAVAGLTLDRGGIALSLFGNIAIVTSALLVAGIAMRRRHEWAGCQRLFWSTLSIGAGIWTVGHIGWAYEELIEHHPSWLEWHTVFSISGGLAPLIALLARPHRGVRRQATAAVGVDIATYGLLAGFVFAYFVLVPSVTAPGSAQSALLVVVQIFRFVLMAGMLAAAIAARQTAWGPTYGKLAAGAILGFFLRALTSHAIASGTYQLGSFYDLAWIVPFLFYASAAATAPASPENEEETDERTSTLGYAVLSTVPVLLIPLIGYGAVRFGPVDAPEASFRTLMTGLATVVGLVLLTLRVMVQRSQLQRAGDRAQLLAAATEQTGELILFARSDGSIEHANDAFLRAVGLSRRELSLVRFPHPLDHEFGRLAEVIPAEVRAHGIWRGTFRRRRRDGSTFPVASTVVSLRNAAGANTHFVTVERDITDELKLRDQLVHSERLSAVGGLIAGVAHEINNPLQAIVGCVELMLDEREGGGVTRHDLEIVRREAGRAGHIVRNLLSFVRRGSPDRLPGELNQIVRQTAELREAHLRQHQVQLIVQCAPEPLPVLVDREGIQQILLNLLLNAEQAFEASSGHGTIIVRTLRSGDHQVVEVADNGPGISPELRGRVFEPFFTTKEIGEGTGLGLSISHGIAEAHGGVLELGNAASGACFRLSLPVYRAAPASAGAGQQASRGSQVLVVDDQESIRGLLVRLLSRRGFEVAQAGTVEDALTMIPALQPDIVICDVRMPDGGGIGLHARVRADHPDVARGFIFITGDTSSVEPDPALAGVPVLAKPFTAGDLDAALARVVPVRSP